MVRLKHRYIICQCLHDPMKLRNSDDSDFNAIDIKQQIIEKMLQLWGDMICISGLAVKVRINRDIEIQIRMALSSITQIKKNKLIIRTLTVAGSSRTCLIKYTNLMQMIISQQLVDNERNKQQEHYKKFFESLEL